MWPPLEHDDTAGRWRSGDSIPFQAAYAKRHSLAAWRWQRRNVGMTPTLAAPPRPATSGISLNIGGSQGGLRHPAWRVYGGHMLVGRRAELEAIDRSLDALMAGRPGVLEITGEAGIGKSRLIAEASDRAEERHALALAGRASEFERDMPFGVFVDALDDYLGALNPRRLEALGADVMRELGPVFPALATDGEGAAALPSERFRTHRAVRLMLDLLAASSPVVLALDDLHWADEASLELLSHLLRKRSNAPVLFVLAYRHRQQP